MNILIIGGCGYIGTRLYDDLTTKYRHNVVSVDTEWFGNTIPNVKIDYASLPSAFYNAFDVIILLAGHSSVKMSRDASVTHKNNVDNFISLLSALPTDKKFIYASSSSVYSGILNATEEAEMGFKPQCYYDLTKFEIDAYARFSQKHCYGLRLGTVCGSSRNLRNDLMLNAMYLSAKNEGRIHYCNPEIHRPILWIEDLVGAIDFIIHRGSYSMRGIYNLASFNATVDEIVIKAADVLRCATTEGKKSTAYNFSIKCDKFKKAFGFEFKGTVASILGDLNRPVQYVSGRA